RAAPEQVAAIPVGPELPGVGGGYHVVMAVEVERPRPPAVVADKAVARLPAAVRGGAGDLDDGVAQADLVELVADTLDAGPVPGARRVLGGDGHQVPGETHHLVLVRGDGFQQAVVHNPSLRVAPAWAKRGELPGQDSNLDKESQNLLCYRYTTG